MPLQTRCSVLFVPADFDQDKIKDGWKNIQVVQALKPVPGNGQVPLAVQRRWH